MLSVVIRELSVGWLDTFHPLFAIAESGQTPEANNKVEVGTLNPNLLDLGGIF